MIDRFTLFVTGRAIHSQRAIHVARALLEDERLQAYELDIVDVLESPDAAEDHRILATPTLLCPGQFPVRRLLGDLSDLKRVYRALGFEPRTGSA